MLNISVDELIARAIVLIAALTVHEFAHAWTANFFGDDTPRANGRLTLNPLAHLDPLGSILLLAAGFGWAKPVPVNPYTLGRRSPLALMWVSLAGPMSNFLLALLAAIPLRFGWLSTFSSSPLAASAALLVENFVLINLVLMLFNLLPIAPLDGSKIAVAVLPDSWGQVVERLSGYGPMILLVLMMAGSFANLNILGWIIGPAMSNLYLLITGG